MNAWDLPSPRNCHPPCAARLVEIIEERFLPAKSLGGWVWLEAPLRSVSWRVRYDHEDWPDHTGEPAIFTICPFCGGELPHPKDDDYAIDGEAGG